jgi:hypothetical protein
MELMGWGTFNQIKIGRQTNAKTAPGERNGYFDSKVLSRMHADIWEQDGKVSGATSTCFFFLFPFFFGFEKASCGGDIGRCLMSYLTWVWMSLLLNIDLHQRRQIK